MQNNFLNIANLSTKNIIEECNDTKNAYNEKLMKKPKLAIFFQPRKKTNCQQKVCTGKIENVITYHLNQSNQTKDDGATLGSSFGMTEYDSQNEQVKISNAF